MLNIPDYVQQWLKDVGLWNTALIVLLLCALAWLIRRFIRKGWPALKQFAKSLNAFVRTVESVTGLPAFIERTDASIATMRKQIENSHTTNMRDDITDAQKTAKRVERGVRGLHKKVDARFTAMQHQIDDLHAADTELRTDIEQTHPKHPTQGES